MEAGNPRSGRWRRAANRLRDWATPRRRLWFGVAVPVVVTVITQFEFTQQATCEIVALPGGLGRCALIADLLAPAWALAIIPIANRLRVAAARYGSPATTDADSWLASELATRPWAERSAKLARWGAGLIIVLSYTREWERFDRQPDVVWLVLVIVATMALLLVPVWWIRDELHRRGVRYLSTARLPGAVDRFLFDEFGTRRARWPHVLAFSLVTLVVAFTVLGQFDALLRGMHLADDPPVGIGGLPSINEFDLSRKPGLVIERVGTWRAYTDSVGGRFGSAYDIVTAHAVFDTFVTIPAYVAIGVTLAFVAWRRRLHFGIGSGVRRAFELVTLAGLFVLIATAALDILKNIFTWYVMDRVWNDPASLADANVRMLWFFSLARTVGLVLLAAACVLLLALADTSTRRLRRAVVAVRSEILLLAFFGLVVLMLPQTADVIRGWRVTHTMITVGLAVVLSMLLRWTAAANLRLQDRHWEHAEQGHPTEPPRVRLRRIGAQPTLGRFVAAMVVLAAGVQSFLSAIGLEAGRGLVVPAFMLAVIWLFGLALPPAPYVRGDRPGSVQIRRRLPRMLGVAVYLIIGIAVLKAAAASVAYARHEDWWLFFALVPPAIGLWRIATRTTSTIGALEAGFAIAVSVVAGVLVFVVGNPELSPAALSFAGVTFTYGSLAYFNSYERTSLVNRVSQRFSSPSWAKPFVTLAGAGVGATVLWFYLDPITVAPRIGTVGMIALAAMVLTLLGAGAVRFAELTRPPRILAAFGIRRTPVVFLVAVWLLVAPAVVDQRINDVRVTRAGGVTSGFGFDDVWARWAAANLRDGAATVSGDVSTASDRPVVPLLLVSSSGGGVRAAAWTAFVLECVFESQADGDDPCGARREAASRLDRVAVMSGVSGGSLGMAEYLAHIVDDLHGGVRDNDWVDDVLGDDYLAPAVGWLFFVDLPRSLIGFGAGIDNRADVMERAWEASWPAGSVGLRRGIAELWAEGMPPLVFNGTSVNDGCRVNVSALDVNGGSPEVPSCSVGDSRAAPAGDFGATHDLVDYLCPGDDVALSTAAGMSARFPVVSVAGRIAADADRGCSGDRDGAVFVVDGGYIEGSGAGTLLDAWYALRERVERYNAFAGGACVVPFMLHIDNGYESAGVTGNQAAPRELLVPLMTVVNSSSGITAARADAALAFEHPFTVAGNEVRLVGDEADITSRYVRLVTRAHPGVQAPLGWTLSQASIDDLRDQLSIPENAAAVEEIRSWLDGDLRCITD